VNPIPLIQQFEVAQELAGQAGVEFQTQLGDAPLEKSLELALSRDGGKRGHAADL
jgi:hypothetical protein